MDGETTITAITITSNALVAAVLWYKIGVIEGTVKTMSKNVALLMKKLIEESP